MLATLTPTATAKGSVSFHNEHEAGQASVPIFSREPQHRRAEPWTQARAHLREERSVRSVELIHPLVSYVSVLGCAKRLIWDTAKLSLGNYASKMAVSVLWRTQQHCYIPFVLLLAAFLLSAFASSLCTGSAPSWGQSFTKVTPTSARWLCSPLPALGSLMGAVLRQPQQGERGLLLTFMRRQSE